VIAVVEKEDDFAADLALEPTRGDDLCVEKALRKKTTGLLTETDDRFTH
jgi:hypothetical protein